MKMSTKLNGGKYEVFYEDGKLWANRYGEYWRDLSGDNMVYLLLEKAVEWDEMVAFEMDTCITEGDKHDK